MNKPKTLFIIGSVRLPRIDAGASRILELCQGFKAHFDKIIIAGKYDDEPHKFYSYDEKIDFLPYHKSISTSFWDRIKATFFINKFFVNDLKSCISEYDISHIFIYSALPVFAVKKIRKIAKKHGIQLVFDVVEFQTPSKQTLASYLSFYLPNMYLNKRGIKKGDKVIAISKYLQNYFASRGIESVRIPFVFDTKNVDFYPLRKESRCAINLLYAGNPKKGKDNLSICIEGLSLLPEDVKNKITLNICGTSSQALFKKGKLDKDVYNLTLTIVNYLGKKSHEEILELYENSDFSILVRDKNDRLSQAGFPTKISESLAHGVPVICNLTSDLGDYLINDFNSIILKDDSTEEFARAILYALNRTSTELIEMRSNARKTAETYLDISHFKNEISKLFE